MWGGFGIGWRVRGGRGASLNLRMKARCCTRWLTVHIWMRGCVRHAGRKRRLSEEPFRDNLDYGPLSTRRSFPEQTGRTPQRGVPTKKGAGESRSEAGPGEIGATEISDGPEVKRHYAGSVFHVAGAAIGKSVV